jgi:hypothetical protein
VRLVGLALLACAAVTLPFYAYAPDKFSPLLTADKIGRFEDVVPHATALLLVVTVLLSLVLAFRIRPRAASAFSAFALVEAVAFSLAVLLSSVAAHAADFSFLLLGYGLFALFPAVVAATVSFEPH